MPDSQKSDNEQRSVIRDDPKYPHFMGLHGKKLALAVSVIATTDFLLFGYDQGVMSGIISAEPFMDYFPQTRNTTWQGFVTSIYNIGCFFGALFILFFGDAIGRRRAMIMGASTMIVGVLIQITAMKGHAATAQFLVGRWITGVGNGINTVSIL
jgi:MFS family permease